MYSSRAETKTALSDSRRPVSNVPYLDPVFRVGSTVSGFLLQRQLGEGGMGTVFVAEDVMLGRKVALKVMRRDVLAGATQRSRFLREAKVTAALEHDNIVRVYHVGEAEGQPFLVMELLSGRSLRATLKDADRVPLTDALRVARDVARGLAAAHARKLVHRDVSPGNVWLEPSGRAKLLDFGLVHDPEITEARLTTPGAVMGTPGYMSPEQAAGDPADTRSDLFSLGCVLYRLVTGAEPFPGATSAEKLTAARTEHPPPPRESVPTLPAAVSRLIADLLAKNPDERPRTAAEVAERLSGLLADYGESDSAPPPPRGWHPVAAHAVTAGVTFVLTAAAFYVLLALGVVWPG